jgi:hypothetical protein
MFQAAVVIAAVAVSEFDVDLPTKANAVGRALALEVIIPPQLLVLKTADPPIENVSVCE